MRLPGTNWTKLFLFCSGLVVAAFFCMKWMESDFVVDGKKFSILGLELFYSKEKVIEVLSHLDQRVATLLDYHLHFDFVLMAGIYPAIASLCMMARERFSSVGFRKLFFLLAACQMLAWAGDITENLYLLKWLKEPVIGDEFGRYHVIVSVKWIVALIAFFLSLVVIITRRRIKINKLIS
jgi:hypothetical protein